MKTLFLESEMLILGNRLDKHIAPPLLEIDVCNLGNILGGAAATRTGTVHVFLPTKLIIKSNDLIKVMHFKGGRGVRSYGFRSWKLSLIIYLADRGGYDGHLSEKFVKILFLARVIRIAVIVSQFGCHQCVH